MPKHTAFNKRKNTKPLLIIQYQPMIIFIHNKYNNISSIMRQELGWSNIIIYIIFILLFTPWVNWETEVNYSICYSQMVKLLKQNIWKVENVSTIFSTFNIFFKTIGKNIYLSYERNHFASFCQCSSRKAHSSTSY